ncbi:CapA family protein [Gordoniibacillus kamchatkensis]|uniref:CapA family protein n=1 Tax=Gordoniibacillus kamchatkensis TaxID=1590651 RepID=UPI00069751E2|nr:CapA family protein [Paenibacillus sp. VKM B-2647]
MIQSRQQRHKRKRRPYGLLIVGAAVVAGVCVAAAAHKLAAPSDPGAKPPAQAAAPHAAGSGGAQAGAGAASGRRKAGRRRSRRDRRWRGASGGTGGGSAADGSKPVREGGGTPAAGAPGAGPHVRMAFVGDVLLADTVEKLLLQNGYDYPYQNVKQLLSEPDVTVANLETPVTEGGTKQSKEYVYRSSPLALPALKESGIDVVNMANNHIMDYGAAGMLDTMKYLDQNGIEHVGTGHNLEEALKPVFITKQGIKIAFLGFSRVVPDNTWKASAKQPGVADTYNYTVPVETIRKTKEQADLVVVLAHWGTERKDTPDPVQTDLAHRYVDAGADLVVASHPHVLQGLEAYKGKWIAYSLGNFIFTTNDVAKTWETIVLQAECGKTGDCSLRAVPILTKWAKPEPMVEPAGSELLQRLSGLSFRSRIEAGGSVVRDDSVTGPAVMAPASAAPSASPAPAASVSPGQSANTKKK